MRVLLSLALVTASASSLQAGIVTQEVRYREGEVEMVGLLAYDEALTGRRPGVLVVHEWWGRVAFADEQAKKLAQEGFVAFAADVYGNHRVAQEPGEARSLASTFKSDPGLFRKRLLAALEVLARHPKVDSRKLAAVGFCFGGTGVLELARSGAALRGVVSFHGGLGTTMPAEPGKVQARVLVLHGADDSAVPWTEVAAFAEEMKTSGAWWQLVAYGGAVHGFTNPANPPGNRVAAYQPEASRRAWEACLAFLQEVLEERRP